jgi:ubiquitin C-terminal hydrolase
MHNLSKSGNPLNLIQNLITNQSPPTYQKFTDLSLPIPEPSAHRRNYSLEDCLQYFTTSEIVYDVDCSSWNLTTSNSLLASFTSSNSRCKHPNNLPVPSKKRLTVARAPRALCLHLRRLVTTAMGYVKLNCHVNFPLELDITPYTSDDATVASSASNATKKISGVVYSKSSNVKHVKSGNSSNAIVGGANNTYNKNALNDSECIKPNVTKNTLKDSSKQLYKLVSVIVHHGNHFGGHYTVYRKLISDSIHEESNYDSLVKNLVSNNKREQWVHISDEHTSPVSEEEVLRSQAYMLYYEKI